MQISLIITLLIIFIQDLKQRSVYWIFFPILFAIVMYQSLIKSDELIWATQTGINTIFLLFQLGILKLYFKKNTKTIILFSIILLAGEMLYSFLFLEQHLTLYSYYYLCFIA